MQNKVSPFLKNMIVIMNYTCENVCRVQNDGFAYLCVRILTGGSSFLQGL